MNLFVFIVTSSLLLPATLLALPCDDAPEIPGGYVASQSITTRTSASGQVTRTAVATIACFIGQPQGNNIINCLQGQWIEALPTCQIPPSNAGRFFTRLISNNNPTTAAPQLRLTATPQRIQQGQCKYGLSPPHSLCLNPGQGFLALEQSPINEILNRHNFWRANVQPPAKRPLPQLRWDPDLASMAERWASQCLLEHTTTRNRELPERPTQPAWTWVGQNIFMTWGFSPNWTYTIDNWANERGNWSYGVGALLPNAVIGHYTQIIWQTTLFVGCGKANCANNRYIMVCNYGPGGNMGLNGQNPYAKPYVAVTEPDEPSDRFDQFSGSGFDSSGSGDALLVTLPPRGAQCRYGLRYPHALCLPDSIYFSTFERSPQAEILNGHNYWRQRVSPPARRPLPQLQWDNDLATMAERWAAQCVKGHDNGSTRALPNRGSRGPAYDWVGQNICYSWGYSMSWTECINSWADERKDWRYGQGATYQDAMIGHYTQIIWEDTLLVGCGKVRCQNAPVEYVLVCDYAPGGNTAFVGEDPYARPYVRA